MYIWRRTAVAWGGAGGAWAPQIILTGMFNLVSGHALHVALRFKCSFRFDEASKNLFMASTKKNCWKSMLSEG